jgi:hypothetical protein
MSQPLSTSLQQGGIERPQPDRVEGREVRAPRHAIDDQLGQSFAVAGALRMPQTLWPVAT